MRRLEARQTCCFTGHRPKGLPFGEDETHPDCVRLKVLLRAEVERLIGDCGVRHFITGMAIGADLIAAQLVLDLKKQYPEITLESAIPYEEQAVKWSEEQRDRYYDIAAQCDKEITLEGVYTPTCYRRRNRYMVRNSGYVIAVWNGKPSGTSQTIMMARGLRRHLTIINPVTFEIIRENLPKEKTE